MDYIKNTRLQELDRSDFEVAKDDPDIRGWDVKNADGKKIGEVEELIIDVEMRKVRYMVVDLGDNELDLKEHKVMLPVGLAELDKDDDDVVLPQITTEHLHALPAYDRYDLGDDAEQKVCDVLGRRTGKRKAIIVNTEDRRTEENTVRTETVKEEPAEMNTQEMNTPEIDTPEIGTPEYYANFYQHDHFDDHNLYRHRRSGESGENRERRPEASRHETVQGDKSQGEQNQQRTEERMDPDYERGLRLWELRSEGGVISADVSNENRRKELSDERRMEMVSSRRRTYEEKRGVTRRKDRSIIDRINNEGLQEKPM